MKVFISLLFLFQLASCSQGNNSSEVLTSAAAVQDIEIEQLNAKLNSDQQLVLTKAEIDELLASGAITKEQYDQLIALSK